MNLWRAVGKMLIVDHRCPQMIFRVASRQRGLRSSDSDYFLEARMRPLHAVSFYLCLAGCKSEKAKTEDYYRPTRKQLYELLKNPKNSDIARGSQFGQVTWGRPPNESYQDSKLCPKLNNPKGASEVVCNGATCVVNCLPGSESIFSK